jgi:DNA-binding CsgD family transcriptional regulator
MLMRWAIYALLALGGGAGLTALDTLLTDDTPIFAEFAFDSLEKTLQFALVAVIAEIAVRQDRLRRDQAAIAAEMGRVADLGEIWMSANRAYADGFGATVMAQLEDWGLTHAERDVALMLLKGLSLRDIASLRGASEATTRQHASSVYRKSGLSGRTEFAAYFLETLAPMGRMTAGPGVH